MGIAKLTFDAKDADLVHLALIAYAGMREGSGISNKFNKNVGARLRRLAKRIKKEPVIKPDILQQLEGDDFVYMPILYVDGKLTAIHGAVAKSNHKTALRIAQRHAASLRRNMRDRW